MIGANAHILRVRGLAKSYIQHRPFTGEKYVVHAFAEIHLSVLRGKTLSIVGESGAGKSSLARCLALLEKPDQGEIWYEGANILQASPEACILVHRDIQYVFQDPTTALNPHFTAAEIISEPMAIQRLGANSARRDRALELISQVGLPADSASKSPLEFSGGQRQRLAIARALALQPKILILDEALSNLDLANQEMILRILGDLQRVYSLTYIHISHDLRAVAQFADEIAVMHRGRIVEQRRAADLFTNPEQPYTRELLRAMPPIESILLERSA